MCVSLTAWDLNFLQRVMVTRVTEKYEANYPNWNPRCYRAIHDREIAIMNHGSCREFTQAYIQRCQMTSLCRLIAAFARHVLDIASGNVCSFAFRDVITRRAKHSDEVRIRRSASVLLCDMLSDIPALLAHTIQSISTVLSTIRSVLEKGASVCSQMRRDRAICRDTRETAAGEFLRYHSSSGRTC
jgi:hypothetical protein